MTTDTTRPNPNRRTGRTLVLAAVVVCATLAVGAGTATATPPIETDADDLDRGVVWAGQTIVATDETFDDGEIVELREVTDSSAGAVDSSSFVRELAVDGDAVEFDTDDLEGEYVLRSAAGDSPIFEVVAQELTVSWAETDVTTGDEVDVAFDSNRGDYNVTVSADGLDADQLRALFITHPESDVEEIDDPDHLPLDRLGYDRDAGGVDSFTGDGYVGLDLSDVDQADGIVADFEHLADEEGIDERGYEFEFLVTDTGVTCPSTVDADEHDPDATFVDPDPDPDPDEDDDPDDEPTPALLEATVTDEAGDPVTDATVAVGDETNQTDADGVATLALEDAEYDLEISAAGYEDVAKTVTIDGADVDVTATLTAEAEADDDDADDLEEDDADDEAVADDDRDEDETVDDADDEPADDDAQPGFGVVVAAVSLLAASVLASFRRE